MIKHLSIIICTFNRSNILIECLDAINSINGSCEVIVINNNKDDNIDHVVAAFPQVKFIAEPKIGLSQARNRGILESNSDWLFFLDDDAKLVDGSLNHILETINSNEFGLFAGIWKAWYKSPPPKWLPHSAGNYIMKGENIIRDIGDDYVSGGVMVINKQKLIKIGGFPINLGMTGAKVAYGEETYVEEEFKKKGWKVGINPNIVIDHLVGDHKYKLSWHLDSAFAKGRDTQLIRQSFNKLSARSGLMRTLLFGWIKPMLKLLVRTKYYRQNFAIDYFGGIRFYKGVLETLENETRLKI